MDRVVPGSSEHIGHASLNFTDWASKKISAINNEVRKDEPRRSLVANQGSLEPTHTEEHLEYMQGHSKQWARGHSLPPPLRDIALHPPLG